MTDHATLARSAGRRGRVVPVLLAASLGCNVTALVVPFLEVDVFLKGTSTYSLPHSVKLMWEAGLYAIAVLIVGFSILFPLAKLALLARVWFFMGEPESRRRVLLLGRLESLGKWSFLDIFIVVIILILTNDQLFLGARPIVGVHFFVAAIGLSMAASAVIDRFIGRAEPGVTSEPRSLASGPGRRRWIIGTLVVLSAPALLAAIGLPFLQISQFLLRSNAYSIVRAVPALWSEQAYVLSFIVALTLVAMPLLAVAALFVVWFAKLNGHGRQRWQRRHAAIWHWAMIDVFGLALLVFLAEGDALVKTEIKQGLYLIVAAIVVLTLSGTLAGRASRRV